MSGNVVVALLTALTIVVLMLYEPAIHYYALQSYFISTSKGLLPNPVWVLGIYAYFAFMLTWMREIAKDMEDFKGDIQTGCKTMPIQWGIITSKVFTFFLIVITMGLLLYTGLKLYKFHYYQLIYYIIGFLLFPLSFLLFLIIKASTSKDFKTASLLLKFIMLSGITFTFFI